MIVFLMVSLSVKGEGEDTFQLCNRTTSYDTCTDNCVKLRNDGSVDYCEDDITPCFCFPNRKCTSIGNCTQNESCMKLLSISQDAYCIPCYFAELRKPEPKIVDAAKSCVTPDPEPNIENDPDLEDDTFRNCTKGDDCLSICSRLDEQFGNLTTCDASKTDCFCFGTAFNLKCNNSSECAYGRACVNLVPDAEQAPDAEEAPKYCTTCEAISNHEPKLKFSDDLHFCSSTSVCLATHHLSHLPTSTLIFNTPRKALVFCDTFHSCATPGHIVTFQNQSMMMSTYCSRYALGHCVKRVMFVNSPRMQRRLRIKSQTNGLSFTALAAKYGTMVEERMLRIMIHLGL